jgi:phosphonate transport system substrate-binding protein
MIRLAFLCLVAGAVLAAETIRFAPLPMDIAPKLHQQYSKMLSYLEHQTGLKFEFVYCASYEELFEKFRNNEIDIAELGPLPYVKLYEVKPEIRPFLTFLTSKGKDHYTCNLITTDRHLAALAEVDPGRDHLYLTSGSSTCGPLMMSQILGTASLKVEDFKSTFAGTHSNVVLQTLLEENSIGGIKSTVTDNYAHLGLKILGTSQPIPGFAFVADSKRVDASTIKRIQKALLKLKPLENPEHWELTKFWGKNIRYGAIKTDPAVYSGVIKAYEAMKAASHD